ncbi:MAG: D-alanyl-D-alanine carboxypeptidase, partial [Blastocatellia bacterium]
MRSSRGHSRYARYDRRHHSKWRKTLARAGGSIYASGVHNFLRDSWSDSVNHPYSTALSVGGSPTMSAEGTSPIGSPGPEPNIAAKPNQVVVPGPGRTATTASAPQPGVVAPVSSSGVTTAALTAPPPNPLVSAFVDSMAERGFSANAQGYIVQTIDGTVLAENNADVPFNPASVTKVATSLVAISKLGPDYRFKTMLYTDGTFDKATGTLHGALYVMGSGDPAFFTENAMLIADQLNRHGIHTVDGNLIVEGQFYFNFSGSKEASAKEFRIALAPDPEKIVGSSAYQGFIAMRGTDQSISSVSFSDSNSSQSHASSGPQAPPYLKITGETMIQPGINTSKLTLLAVHTSLPLVRVLKGQNDFSNNWMATVIGNLVGGPDAVDRYL